MTTCNRENVYLILRHVTWIILNVVLPGTLVMSSFFLHKTYQTPFAITGVTSGESLDWHIVPSQYLPHQQVYIKERNSLESELSTSFACATCSLRNMRPALNTSRVSELRFWPLSKNIAWLTTTASMSIRQGDYVQLVPRETPWTWSDFDQCHGKLLECFFTLPNFVFSDNQHVQTQRRCSPCDESDLFMRLANSTRTHDQILMTALVLRAIFNPAGELQAFIDLQREQSSMRGLLDMTAKCAVVSMHVRRGDKFSVDCKYSIAAPENPAMKLCKPLSEYYKAVEVFASLYGNVCAVYLSTDSDEIVQEAIRLSASADLSLFYLNVNRSDLFFQTTKDKRGDIEETDFSFETSLATLADIYFLSQGDMFVGGFVSMFAQVSFMLMIGNYASFPPFIDPTECNISEVHSCQFWNPAEWKPPE